MIRVKYANQEGIKIGFNRFNQSDDEKIEDMRDTLDSHNRPQYDKTQSFLLRASPIALLEPSQVNSVVDQEMDEIINEVEIEL